MQEIDLEGLVGKEDRAILVSGLQALWRERVDAWNCAVVVAWTVQKNSEKPDRRQFGIDEVETMLRRVGAAPFKF